MDGALLTFSPADNHEFIHSSPGNEVARVLVGAEVSIISPVIIVLNVSLHKLLNHLSLAMRLKCFCEVIDEVVNGVESLWRFHAGRRDVVGNV